MKKFVSLFFTLSLLVMSQSCSDKKLSSGNSLGISPQQALSGVQALLGGASKNALKGFAGNVLQNTAMQSVLPKELTAITSVLGASKEGSKAMNLLNSALGSAVPEVASSLLENATKNISASDATSLLSGGNKTGATDFLKKSVGNKLTAALLPALTQKLTANGGLKAITSALGSQAGNLLGEGKPSVADLATSSAVNGLFSMMGNAEKTERANPTNPILKKLFSK